MPVTAGCAASCRERLQTADHTGRGLRITLTKLKIKAEYKSKMYSRKLWTDLLQEIQQTRLGSFRIQA